MWSMYVVSLFVWGQNNVPAPVWFLDADLGLEGVVPNGPPGPAAADLFVEVG